ncbi:MAG: hypothetical protein LQ350_001534 [Teloschistes chrysophthalmus]|nr:MAG: hypothetical protein LQ350_001534 [Niorma chrysophthalma]
MATDQQIQTIPEPPLEEREDQGIQVRIDEKIQNFDTPYKSAQEPLPALPAYHPSFARVEKHYEDLLEAAIRAVRSSTYHDDGTDRLERECENRRKIEYPPAHIVGLVGDSGVASLLEGYLHDYWSESIQSKEDVEPDTLEEIRSRSDTALEVFLTLFASRSEFNNASEAVRFLAATTTAQGEEIRSKLLEWLDSTISGCGAVDGIIHVAEEDVKSLGLRLKPFDVAAIVDPEDFSATNHAISEYTHLLRIYEDMGDARNDLLSRKRAAAGKTKTELSLELNDLTFYDAALRESVLKMRNRKVERAMRDKHQETNSVHGPLRIVCVSSMAYEVNALGYSEDAIPVSVEATGIPQLRSVILGLPARERLIALQLYCWGHLKSLVSSMESWTVQSTIARRLELREVVAKPRKLAESVISTLCQEIQSHLEKTIVATIPMGDVVVIPSEPFMKSLAPKKTQLQAAFDTFTTKSRKSTRCAIRLNVITDDTDGSYLMEAMVPIYRSCVEESGKGSHPRRVARLHSAIKHGELFARMEPGVRNSIKSGLDIRYGKLVRKVHTVFDVVLADFDSTFVVEEGPDVARNELRSEIRDFVKKAEGRMNGAMETELARAINESSG